MTGEELATHQLRCLQWSGFMASALACATVALVNMALVEEWGPFFGLLPFALLGLGAAYVGFRLRRWHRRTVFAYADEQLAALHSRCQRLGVAAPCGKDYQPPPEPLFSHQAMPWWEQAAPSTSVSPSPSISPA